MRIFERRVRHDVLRASTIVVVLVASPPTRIDRLTPEATDPDFGPNVTIFDPTLPAATIQATLDAVFKRQESSEFGDARFALRSYRRAPGFTAVALLTLALGIGTTTAAFSIIDAVLIRPLPYPESGRIVALTGRDSLGHEIQAVSVPNYYDWREQSRSFSAIALYSTAREAVTGAGDAAHVETANVSGDFFRVLGVRPELGRTLTPDDAGNGEPVAVVSHGFWVRALGSPRRERRSIGRAARRGRSPADARVSRRRRPVRARRVRAPVAVGEPEQHQLQRDRATGRRRHHGSGTVGDARDCIARARGSPRGPLRAQRRGDPAAGPCGRAGGVVPSPAWRCGRRRTAHACQPRRAASREVRGRELRSARRSEPGGGGSSGSLSSKASRLRSQAAFWV